MAVYIVTGKLGGGKTLVSVGRIKDKLEQGCTIATNLDLNLDKLFTPFAKNVRVIRVPDKPSVQDLNYIGVGNASYDEDKNGLLVLDECGTWFNSRMWNDKARKPVNDWFLHARKLGWDVILVIQDVSILDTQARAAIAEHTVFCKRTDKFAIPILGTLCKVITGCQIKLPRMHVGKVVYGTKFDDPLTDRWGYRGNQWFAAYDTKQMFLEDYEHGVFSELTPWLRYGRYMVPRDWSFRMRMTKIYWKRFKSPFNFIAGSVIGVAISLFGAFAIAGINHLEQVEPVEEVDPLSSSTTRLGTLMDGAVITASHTLESRFPYYQFGRNLVVSKTDNHDVEGDFFDTRQLRSSGFQIQRVSDCHAIVKDKADNRYDVYCL